MRKADAGAEWARQIQAQVEDAAKTAVLAPDLRTKAIDALAKLKKALGTNASQTKEEWAVTEERLFQARMCKGGGYAPLGYADHCDCQGCDPNKSTPEFALSQKTPINIVLEASYLALDAVQSATPVHRYQH